MKEEDPAKAVVNKVKFRGLYTSKTLRYLLK